MKNFNFQDLVYFQEWPWILSKQFTTKWVKILNVRNIVNWNLDISNTTTYISEDEAYWKYKHFLIDWDEIIIASSWIKVEYFDKKVCFANKENLPLMLNTSIIRLRSLDETVLLKWYLYYFLKSQIFKNQIQRLITWSAQLNFWPSHLKQIQIPLPSLSTQKQIIQKLDKLSELISLRKQSIKKQEDLTKSIFIEMFGDPMINEKDWEVKELKELCNKITDWTHNSPKTFSEWYPYISAKHIKTYGIDLSNLEYVKEEDHRKIYKRCNPEYWDVLYIKDWATTWIAQVNILNYEFSMLSSLALFKLNKNLLNEYYLTYFLNNESVYKDLIRWMWWAAIKRFTLEKIKVFKIFLPPISLQNKFAEIVQKNEENIKKQKESLEKLEELYNWVMQDSFRV